MTTDRLEQLENHVAEQQQMLDDLLSARLIRQHNEDKMPCLGARVIGEGFALDIVDALRLGGLFRPELKRLFHLARHGAFSVV